MNMRRILKQPTLRMQNGGDLQIPQGPGLDRAGFLARNPGVVQNQAASPSPGQTPYEKDLALRNAQTSASSIVKDASQQAGAAQVAALTGAGQGWGRETRANSPMSPAMPPAGAGRGSINPPLANPLAASASPTLRAGAPMAGSPGVFKHGTNSFSDSATAPVWSNTGKPSAQNSSLMAGLAAKHGSGAPAGWRGQNEGFGPAGTPQTNRYEGGFAPPIPSGMRDSLQQGFNSPSTGFGAMMKDGGDLRTGMGGHVPGSGSGDKISAKYEPGEFVVSNDMLDKAPGLRDMLHNLRGEALADKGMTPEQADAKAVSGPTLRADSGYGLYPYNQREVDIYAGLGKPASAPENQPGPGGILSARQTQGAQDGQTQAAVAGASPNNPRAGYFPGGVRAAVGGGGDRGGQPQPSGRVNYGESVRSGMPDTSAVVQGTHEDVSSSLSKGQYTGAIVKGLRGATAMIPAVLNDTVGAAGRGAYDMLRNPVEDAGRAALGMEDRKEPGKAQKTVAPKLQPGVDANMPGQDPGRPAAQTAETLRSAPAREIDWAGRKNERDALTLRDAALGNQMQAAREASDAAGYAAQDRQQAVNQRLADSFEDSKRRRSAEVTLSSIDTSKNSMARKQAAMKDLEGLDTRRLQVGKDDAAQRVATANNDASLRSAGMTNATTREGNRLNYDASVSNSLRTNESNKLRLQFDMGKDKRDFDEAKSNKAFDQTIQGTEALHKKVLNSLPFVKGDKGPEPDAAGAAAYMNGANAAVARRANELRKAGRVAEAAQLEDQGVANISASDHQNLVDGIEMMKRFSEKNSEWFTSGTSGKMSNNPLDFLVVGPDPKNPKKVLLAGGQTMDMDDVAGMKLANRFGLPQTGNPQTDRFLPK